MIFRTQISLTNADSTERIRDIRPIRAIRVPIMLFYAVTCGLVLVVLCLALTIPGAALGRWEGSDRSAVERDGRFTIDPNFNYESRRIGPSQQFELRLRLVLPDNPQGYGIGFRQAVSQEFIAMGRFIRLSARLPGPVKGPRPYVELSIVVREK